MKLDEDVKERLKEIARKEHRTLSNLVGKILTEWLEQKEDEPGGRE